MSLRVVTLAALVFLALSAVLAGHSAAQAGPPTPTTLVSCLANNGRVDVLVDNPTASPVDIVTTFGALPPRQRTIEPGITGRETITGRADGQYNLTVTVAGVQALDETVTIDCDPPLPEVEFIVGCLAGNGRVDVVLSNDGPSAATYLVNIGALAPRPRTVASGQAVRVTATGRPDGPIDLAVIKDDVVIDALTTEIACDPGLPNGLEARIMVSCLAGNGRVDVELFNQQTTRQYFWVSVGSLEPRLTTLDSARGSTISVTGRRDGAYLVTVGRSASVGGAETAVASEQITVICDPIVELQTSVVEQRPHDSGAFTQGLVLTDDGRMFESTGSVGGPSSVREVDPLTGQVLRRRDFGSAFFGEGLELLNEELWFLSWRQGVVRVLDVETFDLNRSFIYQGEGWGLCHDGSRFVMSNGTDELTFRDSTSFEVIGTVSVTANGQPVKRLNELECVDGRVWANVWLTNDVVRIDPTTGAVTARVDASQLEQPRSGNSNAVLNGIVHDPATDRLWLTGKFWSSLWVVDLIPVG